MSRSFSVKVYQTTSHPDGKSQTAVYLIQDGNLYRTVDHKQGWSDEPDYEITPDGFLFRTRFHALGTSHHPDYQLLKGGNLFQTDTHPNGSSQFPVYQISD